LLAESINYRDDYQVTYGVLIHIDVLCVY